MFLVLVVIYLSLCLSTCLSICLSGKYVFWFNSKHLSAPLTTLLLLHLFQLFTLRYFFSLFLYIYFLSILTFFFLYTVTQDRICSHKLLAHVIYLSWVNNLTIELLVFCFLPTLKYPKWRKSNLQLEVCRSLSPLIADAPSQLILQSFKFDFGCLCLFCSLWLFWKLFSHIFFSFFFFWKGRLYFNANI